MSIVSEGGRSGVDSITTSDCPYGFTLMEGDIPGWGQVGSNPTRESTVEECANRCNDESMYGCCSFEYSAKTKLCFLNSDCVPTQGVYQDYAFCTKEAGIRLN